jgi:hypothetical protein
VDISGSLSGSVGEVMPALMTFINLVKDNLLLFMGFVVVIVLIWAWSRRGQR